jgi:hypothetical protein
MQDGDAEPHTLVKYLELPLSIRLDCFQLSICQTQTEVLFISDAGLSDCFVSATDTRLTCLDLQLSLSSSHSRKKRKGYRAI